MTSYEELTPEMRAQVDNTVELISGSEHCANGGWVSKEYLRMYIADCVLICLAPVHPSSLDRPRNPKLSSRRR